MTRLPNSHTGSGKSGVARWEPKRRTGFVPRSKFEAGLKRSQAALDAGRPTAIQTRVVTVEITAYTKDLQRRKIPVNSVLHCFRSGPGHEGLAPHKPDVASFYYDGVLHFNILSDVLGRTAIVSTASTSGV